MKRLWLILFVLPLFAQENPCDDKEYIRLRGDGGHDLTLLDDDEFDYYIKFHKACRKAKEDLKKRDAVRLILEREENKSEPKPKTREQIIEENRKIARRNLDRIKSENRRNPKKDKSLDLSPAINELINELDKFIDESSSTLQSDKKTCQYDGYKLKKTFESKPYEPGDNLKKAYKWKCLSGHEYWIVE